jgi:hypothetical protein
VIWTLRKSTRASSIVVTTVTEHVRVHPGDLDTGSFGEPELAAGDGSALVLGRGKVWSIIASAVSVSGGSS